MPERLSDVGPDIPHGVDEYRRMGEDFVLVAYGEDRAPGGLGDGEDIYYPSNRALQRWYSYFFTKICRWDATLYGVLGAILAGSRLVMRSRTIPPFRLPSRVQVAKALRYVSLSLTVATLIISSERIYPSSH